MLQIFKEILGPPLRLENFSVAQGAKFKGAACPISTFRKTSIFTFLLTECRGPDSAVGIATHYGLDGPGFEFRWGQDFPHPYRPALGPTHPHLAPRLKEE